jgi:hypothetical protein
MAAFLTAAQLEAQRLSDLFNDIASSHALRVTQRPPLGLAAFNLAAPYATVVDLSGSNARKYYQSGTYYDGKGNVTA